MSAPDTRLVPMTREQRDKYSDLPWRDYPWCHELVAAWDAAPADPAEALRGVFRAWYGVPVSGVQLEHMLAALGCVSARETNEKPA